jgi:hypothetical protein
MKHIFYTLVLLLLFGRCVDPLDLEGVVSGEPLLVVDGLMTDQPEAYRVHIDYSSASLNSYEGEPLSGAEVYISDDEGGRFPLDEVSTGVYESNPFAFQGAAGRSYQLHILTPDGKEYASFPERMQPVAAIDSIFARHENRPRLTTIGAEVDNWGMQFYVSTGSGSDAPAYYQWDWEEAYEFAAPLASPDPFFFPPTCYQSGGPARYLNVASTENFTSDKIVGQPINFVSKQTYKLQRRYSLLLSQYSLTERAYNFWENIRNQNENNSSVFAPPPSPIPGNLYNVNDSRERVLGLFQVSSVIRERIFLPRSEVPASPGGPPGGFGSCGPGNAEIPEFCYDCSLINGTSTNPPPYW